MTSLKFSRALLFAAGLLAVAATGPAGAQDPQPEKGDPSPPPTYDYVQQAGAMSFDGSTLTLSDANTGVLFFSDRPYRLGGQVSNANFAGYWQADDGFKGDPPNAVVSVLSEADKAPALVELTSASVEGSSVVYGVKVLRGDLPESATGVALFIDHGPRPHQRATGTVGFEPYGPYCYHSPQDPRCQAWHHPYHHPYYPPHQPYHPPYYHPDAAYAAGVATGAAMAKASKPPAYYYYPIPTGPLPANCWINSQHTRMVCSVPLQ